MFILARTRPDRGSGGLVASKLLRVVQMSPSPSLLTELVRWEPPLICGHGVRRPPTVLALDFGSCGRAAGRVYLKLASLLCLLCGDGGQ